MLQRGSFQNMKREKKKKNQKPKQTTNKQNIKKFGPGAVFAFYASHVRYITKAAKKGWTGHGMFGKNCI